jgi:hypothetical protein
LPDDDLDVNLSWPTDGPLPEPLAYRKTGDTADDAAAATSNGSLRAAEAYLDDPETTPSGSDALQAALNSIESGIEALGTSTSAVKTLISEQVATNGAHPSDETDGDAALPSEDDAVALVAVTLAKTESALRSLERAAAEVTTKLEKINALLADRLEHFEARLALPQSEPAALTASSTPHQLMALDPKTQSMWTLVGPDLDTSTAVPSSQPAKAAQHVKSSRPKRRWGLLARR